MLGGLIASNFRRGEVFEVCKSEMLSTDANRIIFNTLADMFIKAQPIGVYELLMALRARGDEAKVGGADFLMSIVEQCPDDQGAYRAAERVRDFWTRRRVARALDELKAGILAPGSHDDRLNAAEIMNKMAGAISEQDGGKSLIDASDLVSDAMEERPDTTPHPTIGIPKFDSTINVFRPGELTIVAGRPGGGKSTLMRQMIWRASISSPALVFTLEVTPKVLVQQLCCEAAQIPYDDWRNRKHTEEMDAKIAITTGEFFSRKIKIYTKAKVAPLQVSVVLSQLRAENSMPGLIVLDYLGLMEHGKAERNDLAVGATTRALKLLALEQKVPIVLLCQLNRESEKRGDASVYDRPRLADLRDSGNIEQDADNIVFLWKKDRAVDDFSVQARVLTIAKHRNGRVGDIDVMFDMPKGRFFEMEKSGGAK
jgi:replicative DNA helicase